MIRHIICLSLCFQSCTIFTGERAEPQLRVRPARVAAAHARNSLLHLQGVQRAGPVEI